MSYFTNGSRRLNTVLLVVLTFAMGLRSVADEVGEVAEELRSQWRALHERYESAVDRRGLYGKLEPLLAVGLSRDRVCDVLGEPDSAVAVAGSNVCSYILHHGEAAVLAFSRDNGLASRHRISFRSYVELWSKYASAPDWHEDPPVPTGLAPAVHIGMWQAFAARKRGLWEGMYELAVKVAHAVELGTGSLDLKEMLGEPAGVFPSGKRVIWSYPVRLQDAFLQVWFEEDGNVTKCYARAYGIRDGSTRPPHSELGLSEGDTKAADTAAWHATRDIHMGQICRRGIGKRMETYLKVGMTKAEVLALMGEPNNVSSWRGIGIWGYTFHTDSGVTIEFTGEDTVARIQHAGT